MRVTSKHPSDKALREFSDAFERLKRGEPRRLVKGARVSQNNVSREAGKDAAALRKSLYPDLVRSIQEWVDKHTAPRESASPLAQARQEIAELRQQIEALQAELAQTRLQLDKLQRERDVQVAREFSGLRRHED